MSRVNPSQVPQVAGKSSIFDPSKAVARVSDPRLSFARSMINTDASCACNNIEYFTPQTGPAGGATYFNANQSEYRFEITTSVPQMAYDLRSSCICLEFQFVRANGSAFRTGGAGADVTDCDSVPFDLAYRAIKRVQISTNNSANSAIEDFSAESESCNSISSRILSAMDYTTAHNHESFLKPCFESRLDISPMLSPESLQRSVRYCSSINNRVMLMVPLGMIFDSLSHPASMFNIRKLYLTLTLSNANELAFGTGSDCKAEATIIPAVRPEARITDLRFKLVSTEMSLVQQASNTDLWLKNQAENLGYLSRRHNYPNYTGQSVLLGDLVACNTMAFGTRAVDSGVINSTLVAEDGFAQCINPSQWLPKSSTITSVIGAGLQAGHIWNFGTQLVNFSLSLGARVIPNQPVDLSVASHTSYSYDMYRQAVMGGFLPNMSPAVSFEEWNSCYSISFISVFGTMAYKASTVAERCILNASALPGVTPAVIPAIPSSTMIGKAIHVTRYSFAAVSMLPNGEIRVLANSN